MLRPDYMDSLRLAVQRYRDHLRQVELRVDFGRADAATLSSRRDAARFTAYAIGLAPPALWGLIHNALPFWLTRLIKMRSPDEAMRAFTALMAAMVLFPLSYAGVAALLRSQGAPWWAVALYLLSLPPCGFFFLRYRRQLVKYRGPDPGPDAVPQRA